MDDGFIVSRKVVAPTYRTFPPLATTYFQPPRSQDLEKPRVSQSQEPVEDAHSPKAPVAQKRGWMFLGTFACLALLNFICAIDATILSVALPVGILHSIP